MSYHLLRNADMFLFPGYSSLIRCSMVNVISDRSLDLKVSYDGNDLPSLDQSVCSLASFGVQLNIMHHVLRIIRCTSEHRLERKSQLDIHHRKSSPPESARNSRSGFTTKAHPTHDIHTPISGSAETLVTFMVSAIFQLSSFVILEVRWLSRLPSVISLVDHCHDLCDLSTFFFVMIFC